MAIEAIKGAGMVYQGSTSTAQIKAQAQGRTDSGMMTDSSPAGQFRQSGRV